MAQPPGPEESAPPLEAEDDNYSAIEESILAQSTTASITSSILEYEQENGHLYHTLSRGKYAFPSDEGESDRLDLQNEQFLRTFEGKFYFAPGAASTKRVLDAGTGTGILAIDFADAHPGAEVIGVDLAPIQPSWVPPNCRFEIDDLEKDWTWVPSFDYIFGRQMMGSFSNWSSFIKKAFESPEPGGWLELVDPVHPLECNDGTLRDDHALKKWNDFLVKGSEKLGRSLAEAQHHEKRLADAGFVNIQKKTFIWPTNSWPKDQKLKEVGIWTLANVDGGLEGLNLALMTRGCDFSRKEVMSYLVDVRSQLRNPKIHAYWPIWVVFGQKPTTA